MKKLLSLCLAFLLISSMVPTAFAASDEEVEAANSLNSVGLFSGTGVNDDGSPNFDLDRAPTRHEAVTMLVRLLGKEQEAKNGTWETPFTDVAVWAAPYVGYAYENGLANGTSETTFSGDAHITASQYLTFALRALGYSSSTDFKWDKAWELSDKIGVSCGQYTSDTSQITRGDLATISYYTLLTNTKGSKDRLADILVDIGAISTTDISIKPFLYRPQQVAEDANGNILFSSRNDIVTRFGYLCLMFNSDIKKADTSKCVVYNIDAGEKISIYKTYLGDNESQDNLVIYINGSINPNTNYSIYIPANAIELKNGTSYGLPISIQFMK